MNFLSYFNELKISTRLSIPLIVTFLAEIGIQLTNSVMMGYLGPDALAAGALAVSSSILIIVMCLGFISAGGILIAQAHGAQNPQEITRYWQQSVYICWIITIPIMLLYVSFGLIFKLLHQNPVVVHLAQHYLWGELGCVLAVLLFCLYKDLGAIFEKTGFILFVAAIALPLNALLDYCFIFGKFGFPRWGMFGIGLSGTIVYWFMFLAVMAYSWCHPMLRKIIYSKPLPIHWPSIRDIFILGWPMCLFYFFEAGMFSASAMMMGWIGVNAQAAHQVIVQSIDAAFMLSLGVAQVAGLRVAKYFGAQDLLGIKRSVAASITLAIIISGICLIAFLVFPQQIADVFIKQRTAQLEQLLLLTQQFFIIAACFVCFDSLKLLANNILRGLEDTLVPMLLGLSSYWVIGLTAGYLLAFRFGFGGRGVWMGLAIGISSAAILLWWRWINQYKKLFN